MIIERKSKSHKIYKNLRLSKGQKFIILAVLLVCFIAEIIFLSGRFSLRRKNKIEQAKLYGETIASNITLSVREIVNVSQVFKYFYENSRDDDENLKARFEKLSTNFLQQYPTINSILIAPDSIIEMAYPSQILELCYGRNILQDEVEKGGAKIAIETKKTTIYGPLKITDKNNVLTIINPVFTKDNSFTLIVIILDWEELIQDILKNLNHKNSEYNFAIWKKDNGNFFTDNYGFIINNTKKDISKLIDIEINLQNDIWHLSVEPKDSFDNLKISFVESLLCSLFMLVIIVLVFFRQRENAKKIYILEHDMLTGVYTRSAFYRRIKSLFKEFPNDDFDIICSDIENFKVLNSVYGNKKCDELLCYLANEFQKVCKEAIYCRYSGDIFIKFVKSKDNITYQQLKECTDSIQKNAPIPNITVKYGCYNHIDKTLPVNQLCDRALLAAKSILHKYDKTIENYEGPISHKHLREHELESSFSNAIANENFKIWFQPKFDAKTEKLVGAEALVRWQQNDGTIVPPNDFIYVFENDGLIVRLDEYVFRKVCAIIRNWLDEGVTVLPISVNVSRASLHHSQTIENYKNIVKEFGIPIDLVSLEITESTAYESKQIEQLATELKQNGFRIDMDDFGTGLSSLAALNIIPFDVVKIDKSLVDFIGTPDGNEIIKHAIEIFHYKKIHVVAEGVENKEQLDFLKTLNCECIQGYYFSPPLPYDKCIEYIKKLEKENRILNTSSQDTLRLKS